jgi:hypothetical protein
MRGRSLIAHFAIVDTIAVAVVLDPKRDGWSTTAPNQNQNAGVSATGSRPAILFTDQTSTKLALAMKY